MRASVPPHQQLVGGGVARGLRAGIRIAAVVLVLAAAGCGKSPPAADPTPLQAAIEQYLKQHSMALRIKDIEQGPVVTGTRATMSVSLTHAELGGASVVWEFEFERDAGGTWRAVRHGQ